MSGAPVERHRGDQGDATYICDCSCPCAVAVQGDGEMCCFCADGDCPDPDADEIAFSIYLGRMP